MKTAFVRTLILDFIEEKKYLTKDEIYANIEQIYEHVKSHPESEFDKLNLEDFKNYVNIGWQKALMQQTLNEKLQGAFNGRYY